jgi:hypothetical protein
VSGHRRDALLWEAVQPPWEAGELDRRQGEVRDDQSGAGQLAEPSVVLGVRRGSGQLLVRRVTEHTSW